MTHARTVFKTMCPMNCHPTLCGMKVTVEGARLVSIEGDETNPDSEGFLCIRGKAAHEIIGNDCRMLRHASCRSAGSTTGPRRAGKTRSI